jgi:hypothetical protein
MEKKRIDDEKKAKNRQIEMIQQQNIKVEPNVVKK